MANRRSQVPAGIGLGHQAASFRATLRPACCQELFPSRPLSELILKPARALFQLFQPPRQLPPDQSFCPRESRIGPRLEAALHSKNWRESDIRCHLKRNAGSVKDASDFLRHRARLGASAAFGSRATRSSNHGWLSVLTKKNLSAAPVDLDRLGAQICCP